MSTVEEFEPKSVRSCLLVFRNKKINYFEGAEKVITSYASAGYYFDKISYVAFDSSNEILFSLNYSKDNYENIVIYCPFQMENLFKDYFEDRLSAPFNDKGILESNGINVFILYCDRENKLLGEDIKNVLDEKYGVRYGKEYVKTIGAPASEVKSAIEKAKSICPQVNFNVSERFSNCKIEIIYSVDVSKLEHDNVIRTVMNALGDYIYALEDVSIAETLYRILKLRRMKISTAESFTGGGISKALVEVSGISEVFFEGLNTYSNESKSNRLGVKDFTFQRYGAVSEQCANEMASGLINGGNCDICIATTGIAGPKSDNTSKPVGLIYIAIGTREKVSVHEYKLNGDRECITNTAINLALFHAYKTLK